MSERPPELEAYWSRVAAGGCLICRRPAEIAHAHGGSIVERMQEPKAKGVKLERMDWLVLPLCPEHHRTHNEAMDNNVEAWERRYGRQADWIDVLAATTGMPLWTLAQESP